MCHPILTQFMMSYLLLLIVPIAMGSINYWYILSALTDRTLSSNQLILTHSMKTMENSLNSIEDLSHTLNASVKLSRLMNVTGKESLDLLEAQDLMSELPAFKDSNQYVNSYYIYSYKNHCLFSHNQTFLNAEPYYASLFQKGGIAYNDWYKQILSPVIAHPVISSFGTPEDSSLLYRLPYFDQNGKLVGQYLFVLNTTQVKQTLDPAFQGGAAFMYVISLDGTMLIKIEKKGFTALPVENIDNNTEGHVTTKIHNENMVVSYSRSKKYGLTFVIAIPSSSLSAASIRTLSSTLIGMAVLVTVGIVLILVSYLYNKRPLVDIVQRLDVPPEGKTELNQKMKNGLWKLSRFLAELVQNNSTMEIQLTEQRKRLRSAFLIQLATGELLNRDKVEQYCADYGLNISPACHHFRGVYMKVLTEEPRPFLDENFIMRLPQEAMRLTVCFRMDHFHFALLYAEPVGQLPAFEEYFRQIHNCIKDVLGVETVFFVGKKYANLCDVNRSFTEARRLLYNRGASPARILTFDDSSSNCGSYDYSSTREGKLLDLVEAGCFEKICRELDTIYRENFCDKNLSPYMKDLLFSRMIGTLLCSKWNKVVPLPAIDLQNTPPDDFFRILKVNYEKLCKKSAERNRKIQADMENKIILFIQAEYRNPQLSLSMLSFKFGMTETYLSALIKRKAGEKFSVYVERLRISKANELLHKHSLSISEVGNQVGYENATTFGRAYKRVMGYSPSMYLQLLRRNDAMTQQ